MDKEATKPEWFVDPLSEKADGRPCATLEQARTGLSCWTEEMPSSVWMIRAKLLKILPSLRGQLWYIAFHMGDRDQDLLAACLANEDRL